MSKLIDKIKALLVEEAPPATPPPTPPPPHNPLDIKDPLPPAEPPPAEPPPPVDPVEAQIAEALKLQKATLEGAFEEKLKNIKSDTKPPAITPPPAEPAEGVDFKRWNEEVSKINKRISHLN